MLGQRFPACNLAQLFILIKIVRKALSRNQVRHLLGSGSVRASFEHTLDTLRVIDFQSYPKRVRILLEFHVQLESHIQHDQPFHVCGREHRLRDDVWANFCYSICVSQRDNVVDQFHLQQQVNRIHFCMVLHVEWHNFPNQLLQIVAGSFLLLAALPILSNDLPTKVAHVFLSPGRQTLLRPLKPVFERLSLLCLGHAGAQDRQHVGEEPLRCSRGHRIVVLAEFAVVRPQKL
mmetsp:Transcript_41710/g.100029  ORF Transcript_41710/g.100029 Transcript_41710/m.100029 type:complete len:233 (-) Transcript_41710:174-872(-)